MRKKFTVKLIWQSLKEAASGFVDDKVPKLSAALAYYTGFALAPLFILVMSIASIFVGAEAVQGTVEHEVSDFVGSEAARQLQDIIRNAAISGKNTLMTIIGAVALAIGATTIFAELQDSMNSIWGLKPKPKVGFMKTIYTRVLSFGMIAVLGFLLLVSLMATTALESVNQRLRELLPDVAVVLFYVVNAILTLAVATILFGFVFKVLPDAKIKWKDILPGAFATALLFALGKFGISLYIGNSDVASVYGAAGSLAIIFVWIYYSSFILYFGAEFTKTLALNRGAKVVPNKYAQWDERPAVAGAEPKAVPESPTGQLEKSPAPSERAERPKAKQQPAPQLALAKSERVEELRPAVRDAGRSRGEQKEDPGMGTVLLGLALYLMNKNKDEE